MNLRFTPSVVSHIGVALFKQITKESLTDFLLTLGVLNLCGFLKQLQDLLLGRLKVFVALDLGVEAALCL